MIVKKISVLFVCLGNICRSPTAEGVFRKKIEQRGLSDRVTIDSAGTSDWHINSSPDSRTMQAAQKRGYDLSKLRGRQVEQQDFLVFDHILAMDSDNFSNLLSMKSAVQSHAPLPKASLANVELFLNFGYEGQLKNVPDPYHGGRDGFEEVLDLVEVACDGLLAHVQNELNET